MQTMQERILVTQELRKERDDGGKRSDPENCR